MPRYNPEQRLGEPTEGFIVDGKLGDYIFNKIESSARVRFGEGTAILAVLVTGGRDENLVRLSGAEYDDGNDWDSPFSLSNPEMRMATSFDFQLRDENPLEVKMAVYAGTNNGALFTQEYMQDRGKPAGAMIRVPVPRSMEDEVKEIAEDMTGCSLTKVEAGTFNERYQLSQDMEPPHDYVEPHIKCEGIVDRGDLIETFDTVTATVERGVRKSS